MSAREVIPDVTGSRADSSPATTPPSGPGNPLDLLLAHLQGLIRADGAAFVAVEPEPASIGAAARWFAPGAVREVIEPALSRPSYGELPVLAEVARGRGSPLLLPRVDDWEAAPRLRAGFESGPADAGAWDLFAQASVIACPLRTTIGRTLGVLVVVSIDPDRRLRKPDLRLVEVLADLAALALERSELLTAEGARARRELLLKRAAEDVSRSLESEQVYGRVLNHAVKLTGSDRGSLSRLQPGSSRLLTVVCSDEWPAEVTEPAVPADVIRHRAPIAGPAAMHAPVVLGPRIFGVLSVARDADPPFVDAELELLQELARIAAAAMANAIDFERERGISEALTRGFVPKSLPEVPGHELGVLYEPADSQPTGGDLYGVWPLPGDGVAVLVGDVAGKGVETAAMSAMARFFIEARSWDCTRPGQVLEQANLMLRDRLPSDTFVTAFFAHLTADGLCYVNAGHHAPGLLGRGGLDFTAAGGLPLGIEASPSYEEHRIEFQPGNLMLCFTDGLVEARRAGELFGAERFRQAVIHASGETGDLAEFVRLVHREVQDWAGGLSDDAVLLAIRRSAAS